MVITLSIALLRTSSQLYAQREAVLSDDGAVVTVAKVPNALRLADFSNHLGLIRPGTRVRAFESKRDPAVPATWIKVEILEGEYRGKIGWALSQTVHLQQAQPKRETNAESRGRANRIAGGSTVDRPMSAPLDNDEQPPHEATHRVTANTAMFSIPSIYGVGNKQIEDGTWVEALAARDDAITSFRWIRIRVLTGHNRGKTAWVPSHTLKERLKRYVIIANPTDDKAWPMAERLARDEEIDLVATQDLENLVDSDVDLSTAAEIVVFEHSYSPALPGAIWSGDSPSSLADKLRKSGIRNEATVELFICKAGAKIDGTFSFAARLATALGMPVRAYAHYVRVKPTRVNLTVTELFWVEVEGYEYEADPFTDEEKQIIVPMRRFEYEPSGSSREIGGVAEVFRKHGSDQ
jgi:hypothetical protein